MSGETQIKCAGPVFPLGQKGNQLTTVSSILKGENDEASLDAGVIFEIAKTAQENNVTRSDVNNHDKYRVSNSSLIKC